MELKLISIIVPVFNEEKNLQLFFERALRVLNGLRQRYDYEIIFVNDGSEDESGKIIEAFGRANSRIKYIEFSRNFGKEIAISAGLHHCRGQAAIMIDADCQHPPELMPTFLEKWEKGIEVVVGVRKQNQKEGLVKKWGSFLFYRIMNLIGETKIVSQATDFRLIDQKVVAEFNRFTEKNRITRGLIDWLGFKRDFIYFRAEERRAGKPSYNFLKLLRLALSSFVSHSLFPLKLAGYLGILITLVAGFLGLLILINNFIFNDPFGFAFSNLAILAVFILFLNGIVLICLGLLALYIANIHGEVINRPMYIIRKKKNIL